MRLGSAAMPRVLMVVSATVDRQLRDQVATGERPRPEFLELEKKFEVELLDWSRIGDARGRTSLTSIRHALAALRVARHFDVIFSDGEHVGLPIAVGLRLFHQDAAHLMIGHRITTKLKARLFRWFRARDGVDRLLVHSTRHLTDATTALNLSRMRIHVLPFYVDTEFWRPLDLPEEPLLVAPGREHRDHRTFAEACAGMPVTVFVTASSAHSNRSPLALPERWPTNFQLGHPNYTGLRELYARAQIIVVPLLQANFPAGITSVLEAMAMGKPLVISATDGRADVLRDGDNCLLVKPGCPGALRDAVERLLSDPTERRRLGENALFAAREHSLHRYVERVSKHFRDVSLCGPSLETTLPNPPPSSSPP